MNPLQLTLQSVALAPLHDFPNLDFNLNNNNPVDARSDSESSSGNSSDSDSSLDNTESDHHEPDGVSLAQGEGDGPVTHSQSDLTESDSDGPDVPRPTAKDPDNGQLNGPFSGNDSDLIGDILSSGDNSDEGSNHNKN